MNNTVKLSKSELTQLKGRTNKPSSFCANNLPKENKKQLDGILAETIIEKATSSKGENDNENT